MPPTADSPSPSPAALCIDDPPPARDARASALPKASRRGFLASALAGLAAALLPARPLPAAPAPRRLLLNRFAIAGFRHHAGPRCLPFLAAGEPLLLQAEPGHPMDRFAVRICWRGHLLGYVPRTDNRHLSRLLRQHATLAAHITAVAPEAAPWEQVRIAVELLA